MLTMCLKTRNCMKTLVKSYLIFFFRTLQILWEELSERRIEREREREQRADAAQKMWIMWHGCFQFHFVNYHLLERRTFLMLERSFASVLHLVDDLVG